MTTITSIVFPQKVQIMPKKITPTREAAQYVNEAELREYIANNAVLTAATRKDTTDTNGGYILVVQLNWKSQEQIVAVTDKRTPRRWVDHARLMEYSLGLGLKNIVIQHALG